MSRHIRFPSQLPGGNNNKKVKVSLTALEKKNVCQLKRQQPWLTNSEIANKFKCGSSTVGDIIRAKDIWLRMHGIVLKQVLL